MKETLQLALSDTAENELDVVDHTGLLSQHSFAADLEEDDERATLLQWRDAQRQSAKHLQQLQKGVKGTGDWLLWMDPYLRWRSNHGRLLWVNGTAGCGKSVLCAKVIEDLRAHCKEFDRASVSYFCIDGSDPRSLSRKELYRSLISQLATQSGTRELRGGLKQALPLYDYNYIVLDGLDECEGHSQLSMDKLSAFIKQLGGRVNLVAFSRDREQLRAMFKSCDADSIEIAGSSLSLDMQTVLRYRMSRPPKFVKWPESLKTTIETSLLSQANGSFRWLDCQLAELQKCATSAAVRKVLGDLPLSLEVYYTRVLERVDESDRPLVKSLLRWVCFSFRPLSLAEITNAVGINADDAKLPFLDDERELLNFEGFMDSCSALISTYCDAGPTGELEVYVKLSHFTVREFLLSDGLRCGPCSEFALDARLTHSYLARSCLVYFHEAVQSLPDGAWMHKPLARYAGHYWPRHHRLSDQGGLPQECQKLLFDMFDELKRHWQAWLQVANVDEPWLGDEVDESSDYTPLYRAVYYKFPDVVHKLLEDGISPNVSGGLYGGPLQIAAHHGDLETVNALRNAGADLNTETGRYGTALGAAAAKGHIETVVKLLELGASVDCPDVSRSTPRRDPLWLAVDNGHLAVCNLLLEHGAEDNHRSKGRPPSALHRAMQTGRLDIVKALLAHQRIRDANSHERGWGDLIRRVQSGVSTSQYSAALLGRGDILRELLPYGISQEDTLCYAARAGDLALVREYLDRGVEIDSAGRSCDHSEALQSAVSGGHVAVVRELLARGADPSVFTPINAAIRAGGMEIVQLLIDAGADVNARTSWGQRILTGRQDITELLLRHGADAQSQVRLCARDGRLQHLRFLERFVADVNRRSPGEETSALVAAVYGGSEDMVRFLLDHGHPSQLNPGPTDMSPLTGAILTRHWPLVSLLLAYGADVNLPPPAEIKPPLRCDQRKPYSWPPHAVHETSLTLAVQNRNLGITRLLLNHGAMVTPGTPVTTGTPLLYAAREGFTDLVQDLLQRGADPTQRGTIPMKAKPTFPLLIATERGHIEIISRLINAGAPVNDQDSDGLAALHVAAQGRDPDVLRVLLQEHHADLHVLSLNGSEAIHLAAARGTPQHVEILLDAGASMQATNSTGKTPLHRATECGNWDTVETLLDHDAATNVRPDGDDSLSPFDMASLKNELMLRSERQTKLEAGWDDARLEKLLQRLKPTADAMA